MNELLESGVPSKHCAAGNTSRVHFKKSTPIFSTRQSVAENSIPPPSVRTNYPKSMNTAQVAPNPDMLSDQIHLLASTQSTFVSIMLDQQLMLSDASRTIVQRLNANLDTMIQLKKKLDQLAILNSKPYLSSCSKLPPHVLGSYGAEESGIDDDKNGYVPNKSLNDVEENVKAYRRVINEYSHSVGAIVSSAESSKECLPLPVLPPAHNSRPADHELIHTSTVFTDAPHCHPTPINHDLPFSKDQTLPTFSIASPIMKSTFTNVDSASQPVLNNMVSQHSSVCTVPSTTELCVSSAKSSLGPEDSQIPLSFDTVEKSLAASQATMISIPSTTVVPATTGLTTTLSSSFSKGTYDSPILSKTLLQSSHPFTNLSVMPVISKEESSFKAFNNSSDAHCLYQSRKDSEACFNTDIKSGVVRDFNSPSSLPVEIVAEDGEKDEIVLFEAHANLLRNVDGKEKTELGSIKISKCKDTENIRLLLKGDNGLKIFTDPHSLSNVVKPFSNGSDCDLLWALVDSSYTPVRSEYFYIRFKTLAITEAFKKVFEYSENFVKSKGNTTNNCTNKTPITKSVIGDAVEPAKPGSWFCSSCSFNYGATRTSCTTCETQKPGLPKAVEPSNSNHCCDDGTVPRIMNNVYPLKFHNVCGKHVALSKNDIVATKYKGILKGIVFSHRPVAVNEYICIKFLDISDNWCGILRIGFTSNDPIRYRNKLPDWAFPYVTDISEYWARALADSLVRKNSVLFYYVNHNGDVHYDLDYKEKGIFFSGVNTSSNLWAVLDIWGSTVEIEFIDHCCDDGIIPRVISNVYPLQFHNVHGENVVLSKNDTVARKWCEKWGKGIVFSHRPVAVNEYIYIKFWDIAYEWAICFFIGFTSSDPIAYKNKLPDTVTEDRTNNISGNWTQPLKKRSIRKHSVLFYYVNHNGDVHYGLDNEEKGLFFSGVNTSSRLWALLDIWESTVEIEFIDGKMKIEDETKDGLIQSSVSNKALSLFSNSNLPISSIPDEYPQVWGAVANATNSSKEYALPPVPSQQLRVTSQETMRTSQETMRTSHETMRSTTLAKMPITNALTTTPSTTTYSLFKQTSESSVLSKPLLESPHTSTTPADVPVILKEELSFKVSADSSDTPYSYLLSKDETCSNTDVKKIILGDFKSDASLCLESGEEAEIVVFEGLSKLFRFVDQEWKEMGIGLVKIMKHKDTGHVRLLMRRDQVLKVCSNHLLIPDMAIQYLKGSDKSLTWTTQDFVDETVKVELFCIQLKAPEIADVFKKDFEDSLDFVKSNENANKSSDITPIIIDDALALTKPGFNAEFLPKPDSAFCTSCCLNAATRVSCTICKTQKPGLSKTAEPSSLDKSPFSLTPSLPVISSVPSSTISNTTTSKPISFPTPVIATMDGPASKIIPVASQQTTISPPAVNFSEKAMFGNLCFSTLNIFTKLGVAPSDQKQSETEVSKSDFRTPDSKPLFGGIAASLGTSFEKTKPADTTKTGSIIPFPRFTFSSSPVIVKRPEEREILVVKKVDSSSKSNPFVGFSFKANFSKPAESKHESIFKPSTEVSSTSFSPASHSILSPAKTNPLQKFSGMIGSPCIVTVTKDGRRVSTEDADTTLEEFVPTAEFQPFIPLPALVNTTTGEEGEEKLFGEQAKLFRYDTEGKEWKEQGTGELKILRNDDKYRVLMRRDQVLKICANHYILPGMKLSTHPSSDKSWVWYAQDFADGDLKQEKFAARFKTVEIAQEFHKAFEKCHKSVEEKTSNDKSSNTNANVKSETKVSDPCLGNKNNFSNFFKPDPKSWECSACYVRNIDTDYCISCQSKKPTVLAASKKEVDLWECQTCKVKTAGSKMVCSSCKASIGNSVTIAKDSASGDTFKPLSELFKPDPSSWVCDACYLHNSGTKILCSVCQTPKPVAAPAQKASSTTSSSNAFKFGVPSVSTEISSIFGSALSKSNTSEFVFSTKTGTNSLPAFKFGDSSITPSTGFVPSFGDTSFTAMPSSSSTTSSLGLESFNPLFRNHPGLSVAPVTAAPTVVFGKPTYTVSQTSSSTILTPSSKELKQSTASFSSVKEPDTKEKREDEKEKKDDPYEFQFGSPQKYEFNFSGVHPRSPSKSLKCPKSPGSSIDVEDEDEVEPSDVDNIYFQRVIPLPPKVEMVTGEENETPLFVSRAKLFRFTAGKWKERGIGDLKILHSTSPKKTRLVMRRDQVLKVCLNHYLQKDVEFTWKGDKSLTWTGVDFAENEPCPAQFAIRFKTVELAQQFHNIISSTMKTLLSNESDVLTTTLDSSSVTTSESIPSATGTQSSAQKLLTSSFTLENESPKSTFGVSSPLATTSPGEQHLSGATSATAVDFKSSLNTSIQDSAPVTAASTIMFGKPSNTVSQTPSSTILTPSSKEPKRSAGGFTFGSVKEPDDKEKEEEDEEEENDDPYEFQFGSPQKYEFNFSGVRPRSPSKSFKSPKSAGRSDDEDEVEPSDVDNIYFQPVIPLPPKVELVTGEENETPLFVSRAKLFQFTAGEWKEQGIGDLKILHSTSTKKTRLVMRRDQVLKVCLNHYLQKDIEFTWKSYKSLTWTTVNFAKNEPCPAQFAIRFKTVELAQQFHNIVSSTMKTLLSTEGDVLTTTLDSSSVTTSESIPSATGTQSSAQKLLASSFTLENESPKSTFVFSSQFATTSPGEAPLSGNTSATPAVDFKSSLNTSIQDSDDIEFVYELKATPEQVAKALALKLPPNFYTYENKAPCPGCLGCEDVLPSRQHTE